MSSTNSSTQQAAPVVLTEAKYIALADEGLRRIVRIRSSLILTSVFYGMLALRLKTRATLTLTPTMGVDGVSMYYNPLFVDTLTDAELRGVYVHEILHCALGHVWRLGQREHKRWNQAADYAVNPIVLDAGYTLPEDKLYNKDWAGKSAEEIYTLLPPGKKGRKGGEKGGEGGQWGEVLPPPAPAEAAAQEAEWRVATAQAATMARLQGTLPGGLERLIEEALRSQVDWRSVLRRFIQMVTKADYSWRLPNRRHVGLGLYLPSLYSEAMPPMVVVTDASGSCQNDQPKFFGELSGIIQEANPEHVLFLQFDTRVTHEETLYPGDPFVPVMKGGGGTDFRPVFERVRELGMNPSCMVFFTDMMGSYPDEAPDYPVLWASTLREDQLGSYAPPFGEVLYVGDE